MNEWTGRYGDDTFQAYKQSKYMANSNERELRDFTVPEVKPIKPVGPQEQYKDEYSTLGRTKSFLENQIRDINIRLTELELLMNEAAQLPLLEPPKYSPNGANGHLHKSGVKK